MYQQSFTIKQFCHAENISRAFLYKLWDKGLGPRRYKIGGSVRISAEAREEWRSANEIPQEETAQ